MEKSEFELILRDIAKLTDINDHTGSIIRACDLSKPTGKIKKALIGLTYLHDYFGHMPMDLGAIRTRIMHNLIDVLAKEYPPLEIDQIKRSF